MQIRWLHAEQVDLFPRRFEQHLRRRHGQARALLDGDLRGGVADVVAEDLAHQALESRRVAPLSDRLHDFELGADPESPETGTVSRRGFVLIG